MTGEFDIGGVFVAPPLVFAGLAFLLTAVATRLLARAGFYRLVWHRALFDLALFVLLWGGVTAASAAFPPSVPGAL